MLLYHTGPVEIRQPDIRYGRKNADFGQGFYLTPNIEFAEKWVKSGRACMNTYELNTEGLQVRRFDRNEEWFRYLSANRAGKPDSMPDADVIIGPIANDTLFDTLGILTSGYLSAEEAMPLLMIGPQYEQVVIKTDLAAEHLTWLSSRILPEEEIARSRETTGREEEAYQREFGETMEKILGGEEHA